MISEKMGWYFEDPMKVPKSQNLNGQISHTDFFKNNKYKNGFRNQIEFRMKNTGKYKK